MRFLLLLGTLACLGLCFVPQVQAQQVALIHTRSVTLSTGVYDTTTSSTQAFRADSVAFFVESTSNNMEGSLRIRWLSENGSADTTTVNGATSIMTIPNGARTFFSAGQKPPRAGATKYQVIGLHRQTSGGSQTYSLKIYAVTFRRP